MITKRSLLEHYKTEPEIARLFGITKQAVGRWPMDEAIPELREWQLRYVIAPDLFGEERAITQDASIHATRGAA